MLHSPLAACYLLAARLYDSSIFDKITLEATIEKVAVKKVLNDHRCWSDMKVVKREVAATVWSNIRRPQTTVEIVCRKH